MTALYALARPGRVYGALIQPMVRHVFAEDKEMLTSADYDKLIELAARDASSAELVTKLRAEKALHYATDDEVDAIVSRIIVRDAAILDALAR